MPSLRTRVQYDRTALAAVGELVEDAQAAADAAQAAADAIVVPPSTTRNVSTNTVLNPADVNVLVDATAGAVTISLSGAAGYSVPVLITKTDGSGNAVNVVPTGGDSLNGGAGPVALTLALERKSFLADQVSQWFSG